MNKMHQALTAVTSWIDENSTSVREILAYSYCPLVGRAIPRHMESPDSER